MEPGWLQRDVQRAALMVANERLREALKLARADLLLAVEEIDRELRHKP